MSSCVCTESGAITFKKFHLEAKEPKRLTGDSVGYDLFALENSILPSGTVTKIRTGIGFILCPFHFEFYPQIYDKSSIFTKEGVIVLKGVIDPGYRGEILCSFFNHTGNDVIFSKHQSIAQVVFIKVECPKLIEVKEVMHNTERGSRGFGEVTRSCAD